MDFRRKMDIEAVKAFISAQSAETKIYVGGDSERHKVGGQWVADYAICVVVHYDGCRGCKIFGEVTRERDFDQVKNRPTMRLMNEVYKIADMYLRIADALGDRHSEVHLDINSDKSAGSNIVIKEAIGYITGTCNVIPMVKPNSPAATFCADRFAEIRQRSESQDRKIRHLSAAKLKRRRKYA